jgi:hypothetical protein
LFPLDDVNTLRRHACRRIDHLAAVFYGSAGDALTCTSLYLTPMPIPVAPSGNSSTMAPGTLLPIFLFTPLHSASDSRGAPPAFVDARSRGAQLRRRRQREPRFVDRLAAPDAHPNRVSYRFVGVSASG